MNQITVIEQPKVKDKDLLELIEKQEDPIIFMSEQTYYAIKQQLNATHGFSFVNTEKGKCLQLNEIGYTINDQYSIYFRNNLPFGVVEVR